VVTLQTFDIMAPALTSSAPTAPHELSKQLTNNHAPKNIFPDGIKTSGQHDPLYDLLRPYSDFPKEITGVCACPTFHKF
jgi:hypothetical protein